MAEAATSPPSLPVLVLTGFLGSGKTHLLNRWVRTPALARAAFIVNEFGAVGLDHHLIEAIDGNVQLLKNGCVCCSVRGDLAATLRTLWDRRCEGSLPPFDRVVIETTGLADPVPLVATVLHDRVLAHHFHPGTIITTVDPMMIESAVALSAEFLQQVLLADVLVITKTDLAATDEVAATHAHLASLNPSADLVTHETFDPASFARDGGAVEDRDPSQWLRRAAIDAVRIHDSVTSFTLDLDRAIDWTVFGVWLSMLLHAHGEQILRVKGIVRVDDDGPPVVVNGVRHSLYKPYHLPATGMPWLGTRLVFIGTDIDAAAVRASFERFCSLAP